MAVDQFSDAVEGQEVGPVEPQMVPCVVGTGGVTKGRFVKLADEVVVPPKVVACGAGELAFGVAMATKVEGATVLVLVFGVIKMLAGGAFACGTHVKSDAAGKPVADAAPSFAATAGKALQKASTAGDGILIFAGLK